MPKDNPFAPLTEKEILQKETDKKDIAKQIEVVSNMAAQCLDDPKFKKYREEFEAMRKDVFEKLHSPMYPNPVEDAFYLRACMNSILILEKLLDAPKKDIRSK